MCFFNECNFTSAQVKRLVVHLLFFHGFITPIWLMVPSQKKWKMLGNKNGVSESVCLHNNFFKKTKQKEAYEAACFSTHLLRFHCTAFPYIKRHLNIKRKGIILLDKLWHEKGKQDVCEQPLAPRPWGLPALPWSNGGEQRDNPDRKYPSRAGAAGPCSTLCCAGLARRW